MYVQNKVFIFFFINIIHKSKQIYKNFKNVNYKRTDILYNSLIFHINATNDVQVFIEKTFKSSYLS